MVDRNGVEIKTGQIVEITGAYFKSDNGLYLIDSSPGDPSWSGSRYSLKKISRTGRISRAKRNICFWPIGIFINNLSKATDARRWNEEHAKIEVKSIDNMTEVAAHFTKLADDLTEYIRRIEKDYGKDAPHVLHHKEVQAHFRAIAASIPQRKESAPDA